jgi:hypothetical protein
MPLPTNRAVGTADPPADHNAITTQLNKGDVLPFFFDGNLVVGQGEAGFPFPFAATILGVTARINTPSAGASVICDVDKIAGGGAGAGTTIFTTTGNRPTIAAAAYRTTSAPTPNVTAIAEGDVIRPRISQIGSTTAGANLTLVVRYERM